MTESPVVSVYIKKFNMGKAGVNNSTCLFLGNKGTGKTTLIKDFLYHHQDIPCGFVINPVEDASPAYTGHIPDLFIHDKYNTDMIARFVQRQKVITQKKLSNTTDCNCNLIDNRAFMVLDDCLYDAKKLGNDTNLKFIFMNGRCYNITALISMQYPLSIPPYMRAQFDYIFIFKDGMGRDRRKIYEHYCGMFSTFELFNQVFEQCTKDHGCMVIDNTSTSDKLEDQVFWYKADISKHTDFKTCHPNFWKSV